MDDKDPSLLKPLIGAAILFLMFALVSGFDYEDELTRDSMRKDPPRILAYSVRQDSPGLDNGERLFPLHSPVAQAKPAPKKHRRSTMEPR